MHAGPRMSSDRAMRPHPPGKVSDAFLEFAQPLLEQLPEVPPRATLEAALTIAWTVWNAVVRADFAHDLSALGTIRGHLARDAHGSAQLDALIERKRTRYADCAWYFGEWAIIETQQGHSLRVECRALS